MLIISSNIIYAFENTQITPSEQPQQFEGLYISQATIYISKNSEITINSDVIIKNSSIKGNGDFIMKSESPKNISSKHSTIARIIIDNPTVVKLKGELAINERLTIKKGIFDISEGILTIDSDKIELELGGSLFQGKEAKFASSDMESISLKPTIYNEAITVSNKISQIKLSTSTSRDSLKEIFFENVFMRNAIKPPNFS